MAQTKITKSNILSFYKIDSSSKSDIEILFNTVKDEYNLFLKSIYPVEIFDYMLYFSDEDSLKNKMELDFHNYYLIKKQNDIIGYLNCKYFEDILYIYNMFIKEDFRNKGFSNYAFDFLKKIAKEQNQKKLLAFIYQQNKNAKKIFEKQGFIKTNTQAKYIGSDIYLFEDVLEYII